MQKKRGGGGCSLDRSFRCRQAWHLTGSTHNTFPEPQIGVFSNLLDRYFMLNKPNRKPLLNGLSIWLRYTVFSMSHNTPIPDTVSEKWNNETTKEVIKVRYTINITFTHSKENINNYFLSAIHTTLYHCSFTCNLLWSIFLLTFPLFLRKFNTLTSRCI